MTKKVRPAFYELCLTILIFFLVLIIFSCNDSSNSNGANPKNDSVGKTSDTTDFVDKVPNDSPNTLIYFDTTNLPIPLMESRSNFKKADSAKFALAVTSEPLQIVFYTGENFTGESMGYVPGTHNTSVLNKFLASGIRSIKLPFGLCADILYNTNVEIPVIEGPRHRESRNIYGGRNMTRIVNINVNQYYPPGDYPQIDHKFIRPALVTIYPWTDFYFTTDDPAVPSAIEEVVIGVSSDENGKARPSGSITFNKKDKVYTKHFAYKIPEGKKLNIWESTKNGSSAGWSYRITDKGDSLYMGLRLTIASLFGTTNWIGVRASAIPK
jgi:hypothetical protein